MNTTTRPEALNCPNCGGALMSDRTECEFCRSRLKTVACPSCLGLMFLGAKFCKHCGKKATSVSVADSSSGDCPRCKVALQRLEIGTISIDECTRCGGFWSDKETFENLCSNHEQQSAILSFASGVSREIAGPVPVAYVPCPVCKELMNRSNFARLSGIIIDSCRQHGVWFDKEELPKIIEFINSGGLKRARDKELMEIKDERSRLRDEQQRLARMERRSGNAPFANDNEPGGIAGLIKRLLDI
jgi:Zn-finger nucleic acid-binding protein